MSALFETVADDRLSFYEGGQIRSRAVADFLDLEKSDIAKIAGISKQSVRFDTAIPKAMLERIEEIADVCNLVARAFEGDAIKTARWFKTPNPMLGDISPRDMLRFGRYDKLRRFVINAMMDTHAVKRAKQDKAVGQPRAEAG